MAETKKKPFHTTVSEVTKNGFKIEEREGVEFVFSKPEYRKDPFEIPGTGDKVEVLNWNKDKKDSNLIWISSIRILEHSDIPEAIFDEPTDEDIKAVDNAPPPVGKFAKKDEYNAKDRKIGLLALHKSICPVLIQSGIDDTKTIWEVILQHEAELNRVLGE